MRPKRQSIYGLDFIRFFAAACVLVYHFGYKAWAAPGNQLLEQIGHSPRLPSWWYLSWWGWIGVQIFFVISGMVISYSTDGAAAGPFLRRRFLRLVPTAWICATFALVVAIAGFHLPPHQALGSYAKVITFSPAGPWLLGQFWTLPIEISFYGVVYVLICVGLHQHLEPLAWVLALLAAVYFGAVDGLGFHDPNGRISALLLMQHGEYFALGIILTRADLDGWRIRHLALIALCVGLAGLQISDAATGEHPIGGLDRYWTEPFAIWFCTVIAIVASLHWKDTIALSLQKHDNFVRMLGLLTYPLYLVHIHAGGLFLIYMIRHGFSPLSSLLTAATAGVIVAIIVVNWLEPPLKRLLDRAISLLVEKWTRRA